MTENARKERLIYDFGMNVAEDTEYYLKRGFHVIAVEANPAMCAIARERFNAQIKDGSLVIVNKAIGRERGKFNFHVCETRSGLSTASDELRDYWTAQGAIFRTIEVDFIDAGELLLEHGQPYYVKIDIEGHDQICIDQIHDAAVVPTWISLELDLKRARYSLATLKKMGYDRFTLVDQSKVPEHRIASTSTEGHYVDYRFRRGQTGKFGSDLDQPWLNLDQMSARLRTMRWQGRAAKITGMLGRFVPIVPDAKKMFPSTQTWYDLHACRIQVQPH